jgi:CRP-like cAMP-binding protein
VIPAAKFNRFLATRQAALYALAQDLGQDLRDAMTQWKQLGAHDTLNRVVDRLIELATEHGQTDPAGVRITVHLSQAELAGLVGASREAVVIALGSLRTRGLITTGRRSIVVLDLDALRRAASPPQYANSDAINI